MNNSQVAQAFARGDTKGKSLNMFVDGDTVYSYGYHFKIAVRYNGVYLVNSETYSSSTQRHILHVVRALPSHLIIETPDCDIAKAEDYLKEKMAKALEKKSRARSESMKRVWSNQYAKYKSMLDLVMSV